MNRAGNKLGAELKVEKGPTQTPLAVPPVSDESHWAESKGKRTTFPSGVSPGNPGHRDLPEALPWGGDGGAGAWSHQPQARIYI